MTPPAQESVLDSERPIKAHPLGVRPSGNALTSSSSKDSRTNIGYISGLPDELIVTLLEYFDDIGLLTLGRTCKALYAFTGNDELWKTLYIQKHSSCPRWTGTWRSTFLDRSPISLDCELNSDVLYRPHFCSQIDPLSLVGEIPPSNRLKRIHDLLPSEFSSTWGDRPFILSEPVKKWPAYSRWRQDFLLEQYGHVRFRAEAVEWPLSTYIDYMNNCCDESPLYLFDSNFIDKMNLANDSVYNAPDCFGEDLFALLGDDRPDSRWLIVGPERSGSTFHKDPNATSAWNAVIRGSKYWIMFPPSTTPPGVYVSQDESEVTSPLSIAEWLLNFHAEARQVEGCIEGVCHQGEVLHVPSGWWHLVVNLEPAIAITQNFIPRAHLARALSFLKTKPEQISGFREGVLDPYGLFLEELQRYGIDTGSDQGLTNGRKRKWNDIFAEKARDEGPSFSFGFSDETEEVP